MRRVSLKNCPYCGCSQIYVSSSATLWQRTSVLFLLRLVRCHTCMHRHFRPIFVATPKPPSTDAVSRKSVDVVPIKKAEKRPA
jgi:hypothetical protein